MKTQTIK